MPARSFVSNTWMGGGGSMWSGAHVPSGSHYAVIGEFVFADTSAATVDIYLPEDPSDCDILPVRRVAGGLNLTIHGNGRLVEQFLSATNYSDSTIINTNGATVHFVYNGFLKKWHLYK